MKGVLLIQLTDSDKSEIIFNTISTVRTSIPSDYSFFDIDNFSGSDLLSYTKQYVESLTDCICIIYNHNEQLQNPMSISKIMNALLKINSKIFYKDIPEQWAFYLNPFDDTQKIKFDSINELRFIQ